MNDLRGLEHIKKILDDKLFNAINRISEFEASKIQEV